MKIRKILAVCLSLLFFMIAGCQTSSEKNGSSSPLASIASTKSGQAEPFLKLSMVTGKIGYAVTKKLHVLKTEDGWATFQNLQTLESPSVVDTGTPAIFALNKNTVYVSFFTSSGFQVEKSDDAGKQWSQSEIKMQTDDPNSGYGGSLALNFPNSSEGFLFASSLPAAGLMGKALYQTSDRGSHWKLFGDNQTASNPDGIMGYPTGMAFFSSNIGVITCTYHGKTALPVYRSSDGGKHWSNISVFIPEKFLSSAESNFYADAYPPAIYGNAKTSAKMELVFCHGSERTPYFYNTSNGAVSWNLDGESNQILTDYSFVDKDDGYGIDGQEKLYGTKNSGITWSMLK